MPNPAPVFAILLTTSGAISAIAGNLAWQRRASPGGKALFAFLLGCTIWCFTYAFHWISYTPEAKSFWLMTTYLGVVIVPTAMVWFTLQYSNNPNWFSGRRAWYWLIEPVLTLILLWTDPLHNLFFGGKFRPLQNSIFDGGPWFWINIFYMYALVLMSILLLSYYAIRPLKLYRSQAWILLIGCIVPVVSSIIGFTDWSPWKGMDMTPVSFTVTGIFMFIGLARYHLLDIVPIGRDALVEKMADGMILLDHFGRIRDINQAAYQLLDLGERKVIGKTIEEGLVNQTKIVKMIQAIREGTTEATLQTQPPRHLQMSIIPIQQTLRRFEGKLIIYHDITYRVEAEQKLREVNERLQAQLLQIETLQQNLKEQATRDPLTGLHNRRYLQESLPDELEKASTENRTISLVMLDLDHFKRLNDTYGHLAGDAVLQLLSQIFINHTRPGDIVCRYGGEEFLIVLLNTPVKVAYTYAEYWRVLFSETEIKYEGHQIQGTISAGIAAFPEHGESLEQLIRLADSALYKAKSSGRNITCIL